MSRREVIQFEGDSEFAARSWELMKSFSSAQGWDLEFITVPSQDLASLEESRKEMLALRLTPEQGGELLEQLTTYPTEVSQIRSFDHWIYDNKNFWSHLLWTKSLRQIVVKKAGSLDITQACFIVSNGVRSRLAAWVAAGLGYSQIMLIGEDQADLDQQAQMLSSILVGVKIHKTLAADLTLQKMGCSLLLNTLNLNENKNLHESIAYFNFMTTKGVVADLCSYAVNESLLIEAEAADLHVISTLDFHGYLDFDFLSILATQIKQTKLSESLRTDFISQWKIKRD